MWGQGWLAGAIRSQRAGSRLITQDNVWGYEHDLPLHPGDLRRDHPRFTRDVHPVGRQHAAPATRATFAWAGLSPDGQFALTDGADNSTDNSLSETQLFQISAAGVATQMTVTGASLPASRA